MENYFRNKNFILLISKWKYHLIVIAVIAAVSAYAATFLISKKYESFAVVYPANVLPVSEESETEQMLEIIQSQDIRDKVFNDFKLIEHYDIDTNSEGWYTALNNEFESNVSFTKTENEAVKINVIDEDPKTACLIVDSIISYYNQKVKSLHGSKSFEAMLTWKNEVNKKKNEIDSLKAKLLSYQKEYGMLNFDIQVEKYMEAILQGRATPESKDWITNAEIVKNDYLETDSLLWESANMYYENKKTYEGHVRDYKKHVTYTHVITSPYIADKNSYPKRLVYVIFAILGSLVLSILVLSFIESKKQSK